MPVPRPSVPFAAAALAAALLSGCGSSGKPTVKALSPQEQVRVVVRSFGLASAKKDYQTICDRLIAKQLSDNVEELGLPCPKAFAKGLGAVKGAKLRIQEIRIAGTTAFATVHSTAIGQAPSDDTLKLVSVGGAWRISSLSAALPRRPKASSTSTVPPGAIPTP